MNAEDIKTKYDKLLIKFNQTRSKVDLLTELNLNLQKQNLELQRELDRLRSARVVLPNRNRVQ